MSNTKRTTKFGLLVAVLIVTVSAAVQAQPFRHGGFGITVVPSSPFGIGGRPYYDPYWGPYLPYGVYAGAYPYVVHDPTARVRVEGVPKRTEVFVDGYFAGRAGTVAMTPGGHAITLFLPGYQTVTQNIYVRPGSTVKMHDTMATLGAGEVSAPPPSPANTVEK